MRILLAEDDELLGSGLRAGLDQRGFQVDWVRDGIAAERELMEPLRRWADVVISTSNFTANDLQQAIQLLKAEDLEVPLQFENYR